MWSISFSYFDKIGEALVTVTCSNSRDNKKKKEYWFS